MKSSWSITTVTVSINNNEKTMVQDTRLVPFCTCLYGGRIDHLTANAIKKAGFVRRSQEL